MRQSLKSIENILKQFPDSPSEYREFVKRQSHRHRINKIEELEGAYLFGAANLGRSFTKILSQQGVKLAGIFDNNKNTWGQRIENLTIMNPDQITKNPKAKFVITSQYIREIYEQLRLSNIKEIIPWYSLCATFPKRFPDKAHARSTETISRDKTQILTLHQLLSDEESRRVLEEFVHFRLEMDPALVPEKSPGAEYLPDFWQLSGAEVFLDVGAYDGDTLKIFLAETKNKFKQYLALEPDKKNFNKLLKSIPTEFKHKIDVREVGAGAKSCDEEFVHSDGYNSSNIGQGGNDLIKIVALDDIYLNMPITFAKVDVEGYEPEVISGMKKIIKKYKPKLALCVYHRPDHLWRIPLMIKKINSSYQNFYLRHYYGLYGTIFYAY